MTISTHIKHISKRRGPNYQTNTNFALGRALLKFSEQGPLLDSYFNGIHYEILRSDLGYLLILTDGNRAESLYFDALEYAYLEAFKVAEWDFKVRGVVTEMSREEAQLIIEAMAGDIAQLIQENDMLCDTIKALEEREIEYDYHNDPYPR